MSDTPHSIDLLIEARWIVPVEPRGVVLENHAVAIDADRIVALMPTFDALAG
jgi:5-methylthioadenosine/S-adenosylhomocysteine deaminase